MSTASTRRSHLSHMVLARMLLETVVLGIVALLMLRGWLFAWYVIPTGSMAPGLLGLHHDRDCDRCGWHFAIDGAAVMMDQATQICPNCDFVLPPLALQPPLDGDRLLVARNTFSRRLPRRWEVLAFRDPAHATQVFIKRVVGLPGESVRIIAGDVHINGQIARKTLAQQRALAVPVHCANLSLAAAEQHWQNAQLNPGPVGPGWILVDGCFHHAPDADSDQAGNHNDQNTTAALPFSWLTYHHRGADAAGPAPIVDRHGYNQSQPVLASYPVDDLLLSCRVSTSGSGDLALAVFQGIDQFTVQVSPSSNRVELFRNGLSLTTATIPGDWLKERFLELSTVDQQLLFAVDGVICLELPHHSRPGPPPPSLPSDNRPLAVGARGLTVRISQIDVARDVFYTPLIGRRGWGELPYQLAADEYFVLGDNSPLSYDSRYWPETPAVPAKMLVGKPLLVHWPSGSRLFLGGLVRVPDFGKIRYIR